MARLPPEAPEAPGKPGGPLAASPFSKGQAGGWTGAQRALVATAAALVFTRVFAFSLVLPGFRAFGLTLTDSDLLVGTALGAYGFTMAAMQLVMGELSDRFGRRPVLLAGSALFVAGSAMAALADSIWVLLAARLVQGMGGVASTALAAVGETVPAQRRTSAMALVGVPAGLGFFLGLMAAGWAEPLLGFRGLFWAAAVLGAVATLPLLARPLPAPRPLEGPAPVGSSVEAAGPFLQSKWLPAAGLALAGFAANFAMACVAFFFGQGALGSPAHRAGLAAVLVAALLAMGAASRAIDRRQAAAGPIAAALVLLALAAPLAVLAEGSLAWAGWLAGFAFFASHATLSAAVPSQVSRIAGRQGGRGHGVQLVVAYLGSGLGGVAAGAAAAAGRPALAFALGGAAAGCAAALAWVGLRGLASAPSPPGAPQVSYQALADRAPPMAAKATANAAPRVPRDPRGPAPAEKEQAPERRLRLVRNLAVATVALTFVLMVLGAWVKANDAGLACPDWPQCYGEWLPPFPSTENGGTWQGEPVGYTQDLILYEWVHRGVASLLGLPLLALAAFTVADRRLHPGLRWLPTAAVGVLAVQFGIGGGTVLTGNPAWFTTLHLATATAIFGLLVGGLMFAYLRPFPSGTSPPAAPPAAPAPPKVSYVYRDEPPQSPPAPEALDA